MTPVADETDVDELAARRLCGHCIGEFHLRRIVTAEGSLAACDYCDRRAKTLSLDALADQAAGAFDRHYDLVAGGDFDGEPFGEPAGEAIAMAAQIDEVPAEHLRVILSDRLDLRDHNDYFEIGPFDVDTCYAPKDEDPNTDNAFQQRWDGFERTLKSQARFFSRAARETLDQLFEGVLAARTKHGKGVIRQAGPGRALSALYRARVFQTQDRMEAALRRPDLEIGPPPSPIARAGRMNAHGVPVFYGARDARTAIAEVRPPVGSDVVIARYDLVRPLRLLDVPALAQVFVDGSIFDPTFAERDQRARFLGRLSRRISRAVMPDDEAFEYLVTQALADYLADRDDLDLDGIVFASAQRPNGANVVLFHKASRTKLFDLADNVGVTVYPSGEPEEGEPLVWRVIEESPAADTPTSSEDFDLTSLFTERWFEEEDDPRLVSLKVDPHSLVVHRVTAMRITTTTSAVTRTARVAVGNAF